MVNPYPERIEELHQHLERCWSQRDRQATEVVLATIIGQDLALTRTRAPRLILETDYPRRDTTEAWFSFGLPRETLDVRSMSTARCERGPRCAIVIKAWMHQDALMPALYVEPEWRRLYKEGQTLWRTSISGVYNMHQAGLLRLKVAHPKGDQALRLDRDADRLELARLTRRVLDSAYRSARTPPMSPASAGADAPKSLFYWCELTQKLCMWLTDWEALTGGLASIARNIAILYNDGRAPDWAAADRVLRDCVNSGTLWLMREAASGRDPNAWKKFEMAGGMYERAFRMECRRLHREGVLLARKNYAHSRESKDAPWRYRLGAPEWHQFIDRSKLILV